MLDSKKVYTVFTLSVIVSIQIVIPTTVEDSYFNDTVSIEAFINLFSGANVSFMTLQKNLELIIGTEYQSIDNQAFLKGSKSQLLVSFLGNLSQVLEISFNLELEKSKLIALLLPSTIESFHTTLQDISDQYLMDKAIASKLKIPYIIFYPLGISPEDLTNITGRLQHQIKLPLDSDVFIVFNHSISITEKCFSIWELYSIKNQTIFKQIQRPIANSSCHIGLEVIYKKLTRRKDFEGANILATAGYEEDYKFETEFSDDRKSFVRGLAVSLFRDLRDSLNFTETAVPGEWMIKNSTRSLDRLVLNGYADVAISQTTLTLDSRNDTTDLLTYLQPTSSAKLYAMLVQPPASTIRNIFVEPFSHLVWLVLTSSMMFLAFTTLTVEYIKQKVGQWDFADEIISKEAFLWVLGTLCQQGYWEKTPSSLAIKALVMTGSTAGLVSYIAYSAAIVSKLSTKVIPIQSVEDLKHSSLTIHGDINDASSPYVFQGQVDVSNPTLLHEPEHGFSLLQKSRSAYLGFTDAFIAAARRNDYKDEYLCKNFSFIPFSQVEYKSSMFVKKGSPFREFFNHRLIHSKERGLHDHYTKTYNRLADLNCPPIVLTEKRPLGINDLVTSFAILISAYAISSAIVFCEHFNFHPLQILKVIKYFKSSDLYTFKIPKLKKFHIVKPRTFMFKRMSYEMTKETYFVIVGTMQNSSKNSGTIITWDSAKT